VYDVEIDVRAGDLRKKGPEFAAAGPQLRTGWWALPLTEGGQRVGPPEAHAFGRADRVYTGEVSS